MRNRNLNEISKTISVFLTLEECIRIYIGTDIKIHNIKLKILKGIYISKFLGLDLANLINVIFN